MSADSLAIRSATTEDATAIARLSMELGYPASEEEMAARLAALLADGRHAVFAAVQETCMLGWMHAEKRNALESGDRIEIVGLVVAANARRLGVGRALLQSAERWASEQGVDTLMVRSNAARIESHPFYRKHGFVFGKNQHVYSKKIGPARGFA